MRPRPVAPAAALALVALVTLLIAGCGGGGGGVGRELLDGRPRHPDDQGVVTAISRTAITLDGERTYGVSDDLLSFSTYTATLEPMLGRMGQYVQVGVDGDTMVWMAGIGAVLDGDPPSAYYTGILVEVDGGDAVFRDGTVLSLAPDVESPVDEGGLQARISVKTGEVIELRTTIGIDD